MKDSTRMTSRAAYYGRVSSEHQVDGTSLGTQRDKCLAVIEAHDGWVIAGEYVDEGVSGAKGSRPELDRLMTACRAGEIDAVVVAKLDRFGRSVRHLSRLVGDLDDLGVAFVSVAESFDSSTPGGRLLRNMLGSFAEFERDQIRERTSSGLLAVAKDGFWPGGPPPLGFQLVKDGRHTRLAIDDDEAALVRKAVSLVVDESQTTWEAAATMNALGLLPRQSGHWTHVNLRRLLLDARISGLWTYTDSREGDFPIEIPALITSERHAQLREVLAMTTTGPRTPDRFYLLSKGILLGACGAKMFGVYRKDRDTRQYSCNNSRAELRNRNGAAGGDRCTCRNLHAEQVEPLVWAEVVRLLSDPSQLMKLAAEYLSARGDQMVGERDDSDKLDRQIAKLERARTDRATAALKAGLDPDLLREAIAEIDDELAVLRRRARQLEGLRQQSEAATEGIQQVVALAEKAHERLGMLTPAEQRTVLEALELRVQVLDWSPCTTCAGKGKLPGGRGGTPCPTCRMTKEVPRFRIEGVWSQALLEGADVGELTDGVPRSSRC
jgi:DNA invertase Pin-like site-specific DNA recombinase